MSSMRIESAGERFGKVLATRRVGRFLLRRSTYRPHLMTPSHEHGAYLRDLSRIQRQRGRAGLQPGLWPPCQHCSHFVSRA